MTAQVTALAVPVGKVNRPEDEALDWDAIDWRTCEDDVGRLRQRIFKATRDGDLRQVRNLQKLMLRSWSNTLVSVRQVTQRNAGRKTAGVDGVVASTPRQRAKLAVLMHRQASPLVALPARRVYIPKANGKRRPLGIPVIADRVQQARVKNALEPEWEARFEPRSYGFRPGRGCHDAIEAIYATLRGLNPRRPWVLDADLAGAFDNINHDLLLEQLGSFPARDMIRAWLKAGVMEGGELTPTKQGTPQGGVISPLLLNVALHGMEQAAGVRYRNLASGAVEVMRTSPALVRYADDYVVMCHSREMAEQAKQRLARWLALRGLSFNEDKTKIVHAEEGFSFLGFRIRRHDTRRGGKLLIKPDPESVKRFRLRLTAEMHSLRGANAAAVIFHLNPVIRGWAAYYRTAVSSSTFRRLDAHMWHLTYGWARHTHPNKSKGWTTARYYGKFVATRQDHWVFGDRDTGAHLTKFSWTKIIRHVQVPGAASPDDPSLTEFWAIRRQKHHTPLVQDTTSARMLVAQQGRCGTCGDYLLHADQEPQSPQEWEQWFRAVRSAQRNKLIALRTEHNGNNGRSMRRLVHAHCPPATQQRQTSRPQPLSPP